MFRTSLAFSLILPASACDPSCDEYSDQANELIREYQACTAECVVVDYYEAVGPNTCMGPFQCQGALSADADLDAFSAEARAIVEDFDRCNRLGTSMTCVQADCAAYLTAECVDGVCQLVEGGDTAER